jgi:gliding motility-associated-like protein
MFTVTPENPTTFAIPNAFAPSGTNTHFKPILEGGVLLKEFMIYNRWGQLMYDEPDGIGWDGNVNGNAQPQDTYIYVGQLEMPNGEIVPIKGALLLVR